MKRIVQCLSILFLTFFISMNVSALTVDVTDLELKKGESKNVDVYENIDENMNKIDFSLIYTTYDITGEFFPERDFEDNMISGTKHSLTFSDDLYGNVKIGTIKITAVTNPKTLNGTVRIDGIPINVTIKQQDTQENPVIPTKPEEQPNDIVDYNLLKKIESDIVKIDLKKDIFEYTIEIDKNIEELDLVPIANDESFNITISNQKIKDLENNKIIITVSNEEIEKEYTINVKIVEEEQPIKPNTENVKSFMRTYKNKIITTILLLSIVLIVGVILYKKKD